MPTAEIVAIGTELLLGQTVNTNATFLGSELAGLGVDLHHVTTVGDNMARMVDALRRAASRADWVVVTGGLGPTADDLTREAAAEAAGVPLVERPEALAHMAALFARRARPMAPSNHKQALFPASAELIPNPAGTALGFSLRLGGATLLAFPGVPAELMAMWHAWAAPRLAAGATIRSRLLKYVGIPEAELAERAGAWLAGANPTVAPYANMGEVHLRVTAKAETPEAAERLLAPAVAALTAIRPYYFGQGDETLPGVVGARLRARGETVAVAESCTGGLLGSRLTDAPGASGFFRGGVIAYDPAVKAERLGVSPALLAAGVVTEAVAVALAEGVRARLGSDWALGVTGYADAGPGVADADVGLVWGAVAGPAGTRAACFRFGGLGRAAVKFRATQQLLDLLRQELAAGPS